MRGTQPWEVLLMRRPQGADFAPGAYVFPGGTIHATDAGAEDEIRSAAVRELFEEVGILLARRPGGFARRRDCEKVAGLLAAGMGFGEALAESGLTPAFDRLAYHARWVTPVQLRRRYDTRFFLARMPAGQEVRPQPDEVADWLWIRPEHALVEERITLVYATRSVLETVATGESAQALVTRARRRREVPVVEPTLVQTETGWEISH